MNSITPDISIVITIPLVRSGVFGLRFGTPIPTQIRLCFHAQHGHWLEFSDGSNADDVANRFPEEIRAARVDMMTAYHKRESITAIHRQRKSEELAKPPTHHEPRPQILRDGLSQMTSTEAIRRAAAVKAPAHQTPADSTAHENPFDIFDQFNEPLTPPPVSTTPSSVFSAKVNVTTRQLKAGKAAPQNKNP